MIWTTQEGTGTQWSKPEGGYRCFVHPSQNGFTVKVILAGNLLLSEFRDSYDAAKECAETFVEKHRENPGRW